MSDNGFGCFEIINFEDMYVDEGNSEENNGEKEKEVFYRVSMAEIEEIKKRVIIELEENFLNRIRSLNYESNDGPLEESIEESIDESNNEPHDEQPDESIEEPNNEPLDGPLDEPHEEPLDEPFDEPHEESIVESIDEPHEESNNEPHEDSIDESIEESIEESEYESADSIDDDKTVFNIKISQIHISEIKEIKNLKPKKTNKIIKNNNNKILMIAGLIAFGVAIHI